MNEYVISCNLSQFDLITHFEHSKSVIWKQTKPCISGDYVFVYVGRPYSRLFYRCKVVEANIPVCPEENPFYKDKTGRQKNPKFMKLEISNVLPETGLSLAELQVHGLKTVQCSTKVSEELHDYIKKVEMSRR